MVTKRGVNPYTPGVAKRPEAFTGRATQFAMIDSLADQLEAGYPAEDYVFHGLRGMGKTVFLREAADRLAQRGWLAGYYEVRRSDGPGQTIANVMMDVSERFDHAKWFTKTLKGIARSFGTVSLEFDTGAGTKSTLSVVPQASPRDELIDLRRVLTAIGTRAAKEGTGVVLMVDELQQMRQRDLEVLFQVSRSLESLPVAIIGAGLPTLPAAMASAGGSSSERFTFSKIDKLTTREARDAVTIPAAKFNVSYAPGAMERLLSLAERYPYFIQLYASETWRAAGNPSNRPGTIIELSHVETAIPEVRKRMDEGLYMSRFDRASVGERRYLVAMAELGDRDISSGQVARRLDRKMTDLSPVRDRLIRKGLIHGTSAGRIDFSVPGFADYVRRRGLLDEE
jgi:hypothetical protein